MKKHHPLQTNVSPKTIELLNKQVGIEHDSSNIYMAMASWCDEAGYNGASQFLYKQSDEERDHMLKFVHYINDVGGHALQKSSSAVKNEFKSLREVFNLAYKQEKMVTASIHDLVKHCLEVNDYNTFEFLQWFVKEQREEEKVAQDVQDLFDLIGEEGVGLYFIDKAIGDM